MVHRPKILRPRIMRGRKLLRQRRPMSPDQYQIVLQAALRSLQGAPAYHYRRKYSPRGDPSVYIVVLLGCGYDHSAAAADTVAYLYRELHEDFATLSIVVTYSSESFWQCVLS